MNPQRRKQIARISGDLKGLKDEIEELGEEEQEYFDNMPENLQEGERGQAAKDAIALIEQSGIGVDDVMNALEEACG